MFLFAKVPFPIMGQIRDIMEKNVITIENDKTAQEAAEIIAEKDISFLVVINDGIPQGVLSESDFVRKVAAEDKKSSEIKVSDIMSYKFRSVDPTTTIEDAVQKMLNKNIRRLLVTENEKLVGVITQTDLASCLRDQLLVDGTIKSISNDLIFSAVAVTLLTSGLYIRRSSQILMTSSLAVFSSFSLIENFSIVPERIFVMFLFLPFKTRSFSIVSPSGSLIPGLFSITTFT